jgi:hypothetical protein
MCVVHTEQTLDEPVDARIDPDGDEEPERQVNHLVRDRPEQRHGARPAIVSRHHVEEHVARKRESHHDTAAAN